MGPLPREQFCTQKSDFWNITTYRPLKVYLRLGEKCRLLMQKSKDEENPEDGVTRSSETSIDFQRYTLGDKRVLHAHRSCVTQFYVRRTVRKSVMQCTRALTRCNPCPSNSCEFTGFSLDGDKRG